MQLHEQSPASAMTLFLGVELLTVLQVVLTLVLGYVVSWVWMSRRQRTVKVMEAQPDEQDECAVEETAEVLPEQQLVQAAVEEKPGSPSAKARRSNAQERKRQRKASQSLSESQDIETVVEEKPQLQPPSHVEETLEAQTTEKEINLVSERVLKMKAKKAERKARKLQASENVQKQAEEEDGEEVTSLPPAVHLDKIDSDVNSQDGQTDSSQTASTPSMLSGLDSSESDVGFRKPGSDGASTPVSAHDHPILDGVECQMHEALDEQITSERSPDVMECSRSTEAAEEAEECEVNQGTVASTGAWADADDDSELPVDVIHVNFDDLASDSDSDANSDGAMQEQIATPEELYLPESSSAPAMWCNLPQSRSNLDEGSQTHAMVPQIEGWVAVTMPQECAPPGPFDGLWKNTADERILIEKMDIMFESGVTWLMEMHSLTRLSIEVDGEKVYGDLDSSAGQLHWSDGDVWIFYGQAEERVQPVVDVMPEVACQPCMMLPFVPEALPIADHMGIPAPNNQCIPANAEKWEICWDWKQKGWCKRGAQCEWYHPAPEASFFDDST